MKKNKFLIIFFILTFSLMMCSKNKDVIMMEDFQSSILDEKTIVLDVRTEEEYYGPLGHIDGAILIPIQELQSRLEELKSFQDEKNEAKRGPNEPNNRLGDVLEVQRIRNF